MNYWKIKSIEEGIVKDAWAADINNNRIPGQDAIPTKNEAENLMNQASAFYLEELQQQIFTPDRIDDGMTPGLKIDRKITASEPILVKIYTP